MEQQKLLREMLRRKKARETLAAFAEYTLQVTPAAHHRVICDKLDEVVAGKCRRLIICSPPGSAKSTYTSLLLPAYWMAKNGGLVLSASHTAELADTFGKRVRNLVTDQRYRNVFPQVVVSDDNRAAARWGTRDGAEYFGIGVGGGVAGRRANLLLIDDPYRTRKDARSPTVRQSVQDWFFTDAYTRIIPGSPIILIQTRWHMDDLAGYLQLKQSEGGEKWDLINFTAICETDDPKEDPIGRRKGEALWPGWQPIEDLLQIKENMVREDWNALYQQHPSDPEGELVNRSWIKWVREDKIPKREEFVTVVDSWDTATAITERSAYSVCCKIGRTKEGNYYLLKVVRKKVPYHELVVLVRDTYFDEDYPANKVYIENKGTGQSLIQAFRARSPLNVIPITPEREGGKEFRFEIVTDVLQAGRFYGPANAKWKSDFEDEIYTFPNSRTKDQADALSQGLSNMEKSRGNRGMAKMRLRG